MKRCAISILITFTLFLFQSSIYAAQNLTLIQNILLTTVSDVSQIVKYGSNHNDLLGFSVSSIGDFNGDGIDDIIVGANTDSNNGGTGVGSAYIFFGKSTPFPSEPGQAETDADVIISGQNEEDYFGYSVASAGDFNGDGFDDVIVGAYKDDNNGEDNSGSAFIFFGRSIKGQLELRADMDADLILDGQNDGDNFGTTVASAGDFNNDGYDDVIVGAIRPDANRAQDSGSVFIFFGRNSTNQIILRANEDADLIFEGQRTGDFFGSSIASAGDFNGDGFDDIIVGAVYDKPNGTHNFGSAFIFFGRNPANQHILKSHTDANIILPGQNIGDMFGGSVSSSGDFNGDNLSDVIVGAQGYDNNGEFNTGGAFIFFGRNPASQITLTPEADADIILNNQIQFGNFGISVGSTGDFNGDGFDDIIVGAIKTHISLTKPGSPGMAFIFFGRNPTNQTVLSADVDADISLNGQSEFDKFGTSVSSAGDFNSDGLSDVIIGAYRDDGPGTTDSGSILIRFGNPTISNDIVVNPSSGVSVHLNNNSSSVALHNNTAETIAVADVDNNGIDDVIVGFPADSGPNGTGGTYISKNQGPLSLLDSRTAKQITAGDFDGNGQDDLLFDFGTDGLWTRFNDTDSFQLVDLPLSGMAAGDIDHNGQDDIVLSFDGIGTLSLINFGSTIFHDASTTEALALADIDNNGQEDVIVSFPAGSGPDSNGGTYISRNKGVLTHLDSRTAEQILTGDFDGNGTEDLLLGFGTDGIWARINDTSAFLLIDLPPVAMATGDIDNNGQDDLVLSFTGFGTLSLVNFSDMTILDSATASNLAVGNIDGN